MCFYGCTATVLFTANEHLVFSLELICSVEMLLLGRTLQHTVSYLMLIKNYTIHYYCCVTFFSPAAVKMQPFSFFTKLSD